jgi:hypothetical protein
MLKNSPLLPRGLWDGVRWCGGRVELFGVIRGGGNLRHEKSGKVGRKKRGQIRGKLKVNYEIYAKGVKYVQRKEEVFEKKMSALLRWVEIQKVVGIRFIRAGVKGIQMEK